MDLHRYQYHRLLSSLLMAIRSRGLLVKDLAETLLVNLVDSSYNKCPGPPSVGPDRAGSETTFKLGC